MISSFRAQCAARVVREGGVIAYPTEAVWGLGCDPWNEDAVYRLLALKARPVEKGLIVVAANIHQLDFLLEDLPDVWLDRLAGTWPGPNTWLVPHQERLPEWVTGVHESVAVRVTDHPLVQEMCHLTGPLISTSANPAGRPAARTRLRVEQYFHDELDAILGGALGGRRNPSLIRDLVTGQVSARPEYALQGNSTVEPVVRRAASSVCALAASARAKRWLISMRMSPRSIRPNSSSAIAWSFSGVSA